MQNMDKLIFVGFISSCSGIKGDVTIKSYTANPKDICKLPLLTQDSTKLNLKLIRQNSNGDLICKLNDISDRNTAETWVKQKLYCQRACLPEAKADEFYIEDLKNLKVINQAGDKIGIVSGIYNFGAGDIVEIELQDNKTIMLPFNDNFFPLVTAEYVFCTKSDDD